MKSKKLFLLLFMLASFASQAQKYFTKSANIRFFSEAPAENIEAINNKATAIIDLESEQIQMAVLMKAFQFEKALMQEHFNENYVESDVYPKAIFKGQLEGLKQVNWNEAGKYNLKAVGEMALHGKKQKLEAPFELEITSSTVKGSSKFTLLLKDYNIEIPAVVSDNISESIDVFLNMELKPFKR